MDVLVTWDDDNTTNCVKVNELKPAEKNKIISLGTKVKMRYNSKWYFGTVTAIEDAETGEIKNLTPGKLQSEVSYSECSEDDVPLSTLINKRTSGNEVHTQMKDDNICDCLNKKIELSEIMDVSPIDDQYYHQPEISLPSTILQQAQVINEVETQKKDDSISDYLTQQSKKNELSEIMDVSSIDDQHYRLERSSPSTILQQSHVTITASQIQSMDITFRDNVPCSYRDNLIEDVELDMESKPSDLADDIEGGNKMEFESQMDIGTKNNSNITNCSSNQSFSLLPVEDISDDNDPDYRLSKSASLQELQETTTAISLPMLRSCEVSNCLDLIFDSCNKCFKFLCKAHFKEKVPCNIHGNNVVNDIFEAPSHTNVVFNQIGTNQPQSVSKKTTPRGNDEYLPQTCEVPDCSDEVFSSCFRCNILLCWHHFDTDTSCELHKKNKHDKKITVTDVKILRPANNNEEHQENNISTVDVETEYSVEGSRREFNLSKKDKVNNRKLANMLQNTGQEYVSYTTKKIMPAKTIGAYCNVVNCQENNRDCILFTDIDRKIIFCEFYNTGETSLKRDFIIRHVTEDTPKQRTVIPTGKDSRRKRTLRYYLSLNGKKCPVCRTFFLNTLAVSEKFVRTSLAMISQSGVIVKDARGGRVESLKQRDDQINKTIREHINRFPRVESHYCRENSSKQYLHPQLSVKKMHRMLLDELKLPPKEAPSLSCYKKVFKSMNLSFIRPKKDQCSLCAAYHDGSPETKLTLKTRFESHIVEKNTVRQLKEQDKKEASGENPEMTLLSDLPRSKTPQRRSPEERAAPRPPSAPAHHDRAPLTPHTPHAPHTPHPPHTPHLSPKKEAFNNLLNKGISGKTLPVHCVVEAVSSLEEGAWRRRAVVETDSYVIIPAATAFHELVPAAMMRLGYPHELAASAKGSVVLNNWKPLPFEKISDGPLATVGEVLGELTTVATLRIQLLRPRLTPLQDIKDKLLRLLLVQSRPLLISTGCPLDEVTLAQICRGQDRTPGPHSFHEPSEEMRRKFESWWSAQVSPRPPPYSPRRYPSPGPKNRSPTLNSIPDHLHPALQTVQSQYPTQKTRMRTSFDPELELPKLQRWFAENQHPSRQQIQQYVRELNNLESRRGRKPLDVNNVVYWFKNARAAQKRAELRNIGGLSCHLGMNGFNSRSHSPTNGSLLAGNDSYASQDHNSMKSPLQLSPGRYPMSVMSEDNLSNAGSDLDDDGGDINADDRPDSPEAPLSLCTTKKNNNENEDPQQESPKPPDIIKVHDIKQEPKDLSKPDQTSSPQRSPAKNSDSSHNNNNNNDEENGVNNDEHDVASDDDVIQERHYRPASPHLDRLPFPMVPNHPMFGHGIMYMSQYMSGFPGVGAVPGEGASGLNLALAGASDERRKRNRTFIDPVSEVPVLEQWFSMNTHPSHNLILKYTEELNRMPYRQKFPRLESKNVQFWFKNRRAKCKRLKMSLYEPSSPGHYSHPGHPHALSERKMV